MKLSQLFYPANNTIIILNPHIKTPLLDGNKGDFKNKVIAPIANGTKKIVCIAVSIICVVSVIFYSFLRIPYTIYELKIAAELQTKEQNLIYEPLVRKMTAEANEKAKKENMKSFTQFMPDAAFVNKACACFERSKTVYGPIVKVWAEELLKRAEKDQNLKLVFMARDGSLPYKAVLKLLSSHPEKYPHVTKDRIVLGYFSRKLVINSISTAENQAIFKEYVTHVLNIQPHQRCLMIDIGFEGSMIDKLKSLMSNNELKFQYLISLTPKAEGFISNNLQKLEAVPSAGKNKGIHWLEDTHQGNIKSATELVRGKDGKIYPNTVIAKQKLYCSRKDRTEVTEEYLLRKLARQAVYSVLSEEFDKSQIKIKLNDTIELIKSGQMPTFVEHK